MSKSIRSRKRGQRGRLTKREFPREEILHIRISEEYKQLIQDIIKEFDSTIISQADIVEFAIRDYAIKNGVVPDWLQVK